MRSPERWLTLLACGMLLAVAAAPALADDVAVVTATGPIRIGALVLEPGSYLLRSSSSMPARNVLMVTSSDEKTFYGFVLANHDTSPALKSPTDQLLFDDQDARSLKTWVVAWREVGYHFLPAPVPAALAARAAGKFGVSASAR